MEINGKELTPGDITPLKVKDWRELEKHGITLEKLQSNSIEAIARFVRFCAGKCNSQITHEDIDSLSLDQLVTLCNDFLPDDSARPKDANFT